MKTKILLPIFLSCFGMLVQAQNYLDGKWIICGGKSDCVMEVPDCKAENFLEVEKKLAKEIAQSVYSNLNREKINNFSVVLNDPIVEISPLPFKIPVFKVSNMAKFSCHIYDFEGSPLCSFNRYVNPSPAGPKQIKENINAKNSLPESGDYCLVIWPYFWSYKYSPGTTLTASYHFLEMIVSYSVYNTKTGDLLYSDHIRYENREKDITDLKSIKEVIYASGLEISKRIITRK